MMLGKIGAKLGALVAVAAAGVMIVAAANPVSAPFTWSGQSWCPSYQEQYGCSSSQHPKQYNVAFAPSQTREQNNHILLTDNAKGLSGAFNGEGQFSVDVNQWVHVKLYLPCVGGKVVDWPAFWLDGETGSWPAHGEIDVMEGLKNGLAWHYHYVNKSGQDEQVGGYVPGNWCGWHGFGVNRLPNEIEFHWDNKLIGSVTAAQIGVPLATDPMYVIFDYGQSTQYGGPIDPSPATMQVSDLATGTNR